jgi:hypothetical protein
MKFIKKYKSFLEDGNASVNASTGGMGAVVSAQPGTLPGQTGTTGSGDVSFTFKKEKRKKGGPSQVTDLRDLKDVKTDKVEDIKESYNLTEDDSLLINDCVIELIDMGFQINEVKVDSEDEEYDIDDDNYGTFKSQELKIILHKKVEKIWRGNLKLRYLFDKDGTYEKHKSSLRNGTLGKFELEPHEYEVSEILEDVCNKLINHLEYTSGEVRVLFESPGLAVPPWKSSSWNKEKNINIDINIVLNRNIYPTNEAYNSEQEYISDIVSKFKGYNIRPVILNKILDFYKDQIIDDYNNDKQPSEFVDMIVKDMELGSGGYMSQRVGSKGWNNRVIKYL